MSTKELFLSVIAENSIGEGMEVNVIDRLVEEGLVWVEFSSSETVSPEDVTALVTAMETAFAEHSFAPFDHSVYNDENGSKVTVQMSKVYDEEYDFTDTEKLLNSKWPLSVLTEKCETAIEGIWEIQKNFCPQDGEVKLLDRAVHSLHVLKEVLGTIKKQ